MKRSSLLLASAAVATLACLATMVALREPAAPGEAAVSTAANEPAHAAAEIPAPAAERTAPEAGEDFGMEVARAAQAREQALRDAILKIGEDPTLSLAAKLERFREAAHPARAADPAAAALITPSMLAEVFLRMQGVQRELAALSPAARAGELAQIRRELGFDEEQIARMQAIDEQRESRWQNGLAYARERERVTATFEGDALAAELRALREEYFALEAPTIEREEQSGFYRFERPRIYGRN